MPANASHATFSISAEPENYPLETFASHTAEMGKFENLPKWLNCIPLVAQWLWLGLLYRSATLPSCANPMITSGGMVGEGKQEYFNAMGSLAKSYCAPFTVIRANENALHMALSEMEKQQLHFPVVTKPDLGWCGYGVKRVNNQQELAQYLDTFPRGENLLLQRYLPEKGEAGLFYARNPSETFGQVIGVTLRYYPKITGDGIHTVRELMEHDPRTRRSGNSPLHQPGFNPDAVPMKDEEVRLATIGSTRVGGLYCDGGEHITPMLNRTVDAIARDMKDFHIGRFDVRYETLEQLKEGKFTIMEVNGSGSEAIHAWDPKYSIMQAYRIIFAKQRLLFKISAMKRSAGHKPIGIVKLARLYCLQQKLIKRYPLSN